MLGARKTAVLFSAALLVACEPVYEPEVGPPPPNFQSRRVTQSATGNGEFFTGANLDQLRNFSFSALKHADGTFTGQFEVTNRATTRVHGTVTCLSIVGNAAWIGGVITLPVPGFALGLDAGFRVIDNRRPGTMPDRLSFLVGTQATFGLTAAQFCATQPAFFTRSIVAGNIRVRP